MIDHFDIGCADMAASAHFYDEVLGVLGFTRQLDHGVAIGYGTEGHPVFWISQAPDDGPNREVHVAFTATGSGVVTAFHDKAVELGAESLHEPRLWPEYHERYFGALFAIPTATTSKPSPTGEGFRADARLRTSQGELGMSMVGSPGVVRSPTGVTGRTGYGTDAPGESVP